MVEENVKRGFSFTVSTELFSDIISEAFGLPSGTLDIKHVTGEHWNGVFQISARTNDERFPIVKEGERFPDIYLILKSVEVEPGKYETQFQGFTEVK